MRITEVRAGRIDTVTLVLDSDEVMRSVGGAATARFRLAELVIEWRNGWLSRCTARGPALRKDGEPFVSGVVSGFSFMEPGGRKKGGRYPTLNGDAPEWVRRLVNLYTPDGCHKLNAVRVDG